MEAIFSSPCSRLVVPYATLLLLRDNVQHHLQAGRPTPGYPLLHALADPLSARSAPLPARALWDELSLALSGLTHIDIGELAISIRTRAISMGVRDVPGVRGTLLASRSGWPVPLETGQAKTLGQLFNPLREGVARVTNFGECAGYVELTLPLERTNERPQQPQLSEP